MFLRLACAVTLVSTCVVGAAARPAQSLIVIDDDIRVFSMVAALNVAGFDVELGSVYHPVRVEIRNVANTLDPDLVRRLKAFYSLHKGREAEADQLAKYISLAVILGDPPTFKINTREEALPDDVRSVLGFVPLLQEFYQKAGVARLWAAVGPFYEREMDRIGPAIRDVIARTDSYLRVASSGTLNQSMKISVELAAPQNSVHVRSDRDDYYVILGYAATPKTDDIRHAYLHLRLNNEVTKIVPKVPNAANLMGLLAGAEGVPRQYASNLEAMLTESLVRAIELRIDRDTPSRAQETLRTLYRSGLLLAPYFYESLAAYEAGDSSFRSDLGPMASAIDIAKEEKRFQDTFLSIPVPERQPLRAEVPVPPAVNPVAELLREAMDVFDKDKPRAREAFEKVLKDYDPNNGRALYGLGLLEMDKASRAGSDAERDAVLDGALKYFERAITNLSGDRTRLTWSHIYAGHILDFKCKRPAAIDHYQKAVETGDDTSDAQKTVRRDLAQPFGGECRQ